MSLLLTVTGNHTILLNAIQKISDIEIGQFAPEKHILSINLRVDGLSFLIQDRVFKTVHQEAFEWNGARNWDITNTKVKELIDHHELLKLIYPKVNIFLQSKNSFLIPNDLLDESKIASLYHQYTGHQNHKVLFSAINTKTSIVYGLDQNIASLLSTKWNVSWNHLSNFFIKDKLSKASREQEVYLNFQNNYFEVVALHKKKLEAHNFFDYSSSEEFIFNLLSFCKQIRFESEYLQLYLEGSITESSKLHKLMEEYLPNVHFTNDNNNDLKVSLKELSQALAHAHR